MVELSCRERDFVLIDPATGLFYKDAYSVVEPSGICDEFGVPVVVTVWRFDGGRTVKDIRYANNDPVSAYRPCEHFELETV